MDPETTYNYHLDSVAAYEKALAARDYQGAWRALAEALEGAETLVQWLLRGGSPPTWRLPEEEQENADEYLPGSEEHFHAWLGATSFSGTQVDPPEWYSAGMDLIGRLPIEVFPMTAEDIWSYGRGSVWFDGEGYLSAGWYFWHCFPGCLPDSDPFLVTDDIDASETEVLRLLLLECEVC